MTDDDFTVSQEKAGALTRPVIRWGSSSQIDRSFELMFMFSLHDGDAIHDMCREAGFPEYPETVPEPLETLATRYTGAAPSIADAEDIPASKCWLLVHFASTHHEYLAAKDRGDVIAAMQAGFMLGRLTEFWRWRSEGHDLAAVQQASFSSGRAKQTGGEAARASKDRRRQAIVGIVEKLGDAPRFEAGEVNFSEWAIWWPWAACGGRGHETGLSLLSGLQDASPRVWAALSTSGMVGLVLPRNPGELVLAPDGDAPGREAANKLAACACAAGWRVRIMRCLDGSDWNDLAHEVAA